MWDSPAGIYTTVLRNINECPVPWGNHMHNCNHMMTMNDVNVVCTAKSVAYLMTLEALLINTIKLELNTKDDYRCLTLTIKI